MVPIKLNTCATDVNLYVVRHGKTMFNTVERVQGWSDTPLTSLGVAVVEQLGRGLKDVDFTAVYSSDLGRARQTARIILAAQGDTQPVIEMPEFRELCFGSFEGDFDLNMWKAVAKKLNYKNNVELLEDFRARSLTLDTIVDALKALDESDMGEDYVTLKERMLVGLKDVAKKVQQKGGGNVLIVTHGLALLAMINELLNKPFNEEAKNASVTKIHYNSEGKFTVESLGDTSYIEKGK